LIQCLFIFIFVFWIITFPDICIFLLFPYKIEKKCIIFLNYFNLFKYCFKSIFKWKGRLFFKLFAIGFKNILKEHKFSDVTDEWNGKK